jgi:hypothetical protein
MTENEAQIKSMIHRSKCAGECHHSVRIECPTTALRVSVDRTGLRVGLYVRPVTRYLHLQAEPCHQQCACLILLFCGHQCYRNRGVLDAYRPLIYL